MTTVRDPSTNILASVTLCRSCKASIYWSRTDKGKWAPFDVTAGQPTRTNHFSTCPHARQWTKRAKKPAEDSPLQPRMEDA